MMKDKFQDCGGPYPLEAEHTKTNYEDVEMTGAERAVMNLLKSDYIQIAGKRLLHVGLGNGQLYETLGVHLASYTTITISQSEIDKFYHLNGGVNDSRALLINKHDPSRYVDIGGPFDLIIDVNLKSFACCEKHFSAYIDFVVHALAPAGQVFTAQSGLEFGWHGNTQRGYTPGMDTAPEVGALRVLGVEGLKQLSHQYGLTLRSKRVSSCDRGRDILEPVWIMQKTA